MLDVGILLHKADIPQVLSKLGIIFERKKNKRGYELYFACPTKNHLDDPIKKRVSIAESGKYKGFFNCWACNFNGNLIHLIRQCNKWNFNQAVAFLENDFGSGSLVGIESLKFRLKMNKEEEQLIENLPTFSLPDDYKLITKSNTHAAKNAMDWLINERNINPEMMEKYEIGMTRDQEIGDMIVIPIKFFGETNSIFKAQPFKGGIKRYPKNSPQGEIIFNYDACLEYGEYVLMESVLDVIKYDSVTGVPAMACFTNMISEKQLRLLRRFENHGVMPDLDGKRGWDLVDRIVPQVGKGLWIYFCPLGKDPGDCTPEELLHANLNRMRYFDYESEQIVANLTQSNVVINSIRKK